MRVLAWTVVLLGACGNVANNAPPTDAPDPDALVCTSAQRACSVSCIDSMATNDHCGSCENACQTVGSMCMAGHCVDNIRSCAQIHMLSPSATSGFYNFLDGA